MVISSWDGWVVSALRHQIPAATSLGPPAWLPVGIGIMLAGTVMVLRVAAIHQIAAAIGVVHDHAALVVTDHDRPVAAAARGWWAG